MKGSVPGERIGIAAATDAFLRAFSIQGSWNYRTMTGNGFAFSLLPVLRRLFEGSELDDAIARHSERFNAHPYLTNLALGAVARMEAEGRGPDEVRRFKKAVAGPLGGLGDTLVWATLLPTTLLLALLLVWIGAPGWLAVVLFLCLYNVAHIALRVWAFRTGLREGARVAGQLRSAGLGRRAEQLASTGSALAGALIALLVLADPGLSDPWWTWKPLAVAAVGIGLAGGHRVWRPAAVAVVAAVGILSLYPIIF